MGSYSRCGSCFRRHVLKGLVYIRFISVILSSFPFFMGEKRVEQIDLPVGFADITFSQLFEEW